MPTIQSVQELQQAHAEFCAEKYHFCVQCGRAVPPRDLDPLKLLDWYLTNDPLFKRAYDQGRYDERENQTIREERQPRERRRLNL